MKSPKNVVEIRSEQKDLRSGTEITSPKLGSEPVETVTGGMSQETEAP